MIFGPHVKAEAIRSSHQQSTVERVKQNEIVLAIPDTTELNYTHHPSKKGMGHTDSRTSGGLKVHMATRYTLRYTATPARSVFCASSNGVPLGILHQGARDISTIGKKPTHS